MNRLEAQQKRWDETAPVLPEGWTRVPLGPRQDPFDAIPDHVAEEVDRPLMLEWRPSTMGGWGEAAIWYGPVETDY